MRYLYLTCACLLATLSLAAQQNFIPGTVMLPGGDSARGRIDYRKWDKSPLQIVFRDDNGVEKTYKPEDIKGFRVAENDETYLSVNALMDVTKETVDILSASRERDSVSGTFFFRQLMNGPVKLLLYVDRNNREHFAVMEKDSVTQLVKKTVYVHDHDSPDYSKLLTHYFYRQQLANIAGECVPQQKVLRLDYSEKDIRKILQQYTACRYPGEKVVLRKEDRQTKATVGVMGGGSRPSRVSPAIIRSPGGNTIRNFHPWPVFSWTSRFPATVRSSHGTTNWYTPPAPWLPPSCATVCVTK